MESLAIDLNQVLEDYDLFNRLSGNKRIFNGKEYHELKDGTFIRFDFDSGLEHLIPA